nr:flagellar assembly protein FliW [Ruthenibacterium lactatiformans]
MKLHTRDFGEIEIDEKEIVTFCVPLYGFETYRKFVFLYQKEFGEHFIWMQSVEKSSLCFILANPQMILKNYTPELTDEERALLGNDEYLYWLMTSLREPFENSTVNVKSPIVVNPKRHLAAQLILENDFPIRYPLFGKEEERC